MRGFWFVAIALAAFLPVEAAEETKPAPLRWPAVVDHIRYFPVVKHEAAMVGGKFAGSNASATEGFQTLATITQAPKPGEWTEIALDNREPYRWLRYESPAHSHGFVAEIEFLAGSQRIDGIPFVRYDTPGGDGRKAFDHDTSTWVISRENDQPLACLDTWDRSATRAPVFRPGPLEYAEPQEVALVCPGPAGDAEIRYTLDGTMPTAANSKVYTQPIRMDRTTTLVATAHKAALAESPPTWGTFLVGPSAKPGLHTFHIGNSLTGTTNQFARFARTAGYDHTYINFTMGGAWTNKLWNIGLVEKKADWEKALTSLPRIDHFTVQPRDFDIAEEADYEIRFFDLIRKHSPGMQPWLYIEWVERARQRPTDQGIVPSRQMKKLYPAQTWEESMSAMLLYGEDLQQQVLENYHGGRRPRIIPSCLAMGWIHNMIDRGQVPGMPPGSFYPELFGDQVHPNHSGGYLVDLTWFAAFYRQSPVGTVLPVSTPVTAEQAAVMQELAWSVVKNYPDCGQYEAGTTPVAKPEFLAAAAAASAGATVPITLTSTTPGAWFRYTLDGTVPTRTRGYVYCGIVSVPPEATLKAVAYRSGMADSPVSEWKPPVR
ncbi:MAG TPA: chitobiase/beta-hexosaminidase C-terminal domain-containing protein [Pirellulales bacterium]|jgi:hypothetical protein|nr:chitobiase/beta-hexosaminidase C-terminal domain-containing protein [Pirellulales bacterium]